MTWVVAALLGIGIGSLPTADWLARSRGIDLRASGSRNPGTNNALRVGGRGLAMSVLAAEIVKGAVAIVAGHRIGADTAAALAGIGATAGNVYNPWFRGKGGKGLAITGGILLAAWPTMAAVLIAVLAAAVAGFRRTGPASLTALGVYGVVSVVGIGVDLPTGGLIDTAPALLMLAAGVIALLTPKHLADTLRSGGPPTSPG